jgi:hypothetical protein
VSTTDPTSVVLGESVQFTAATLDAHGNVVADVSAAATFASTADDDVLLVGVLTPSSVGVRAVTASWGALAAAPVRVVVFSDAPTLVELPVLSTTAPRHGEPVTVTPGGWSPAPTSVAYQWLRDGTPIPGATGPSHTPDLDDLGARLSVRITTGRTGLLGAGRITTSPSEPVGLAPAPSVSPEVSGDPTTAEVGTLLRGEVTLPPGWAATYEWLRDGVPIPGATGTAYQVVAADQGHQVAWRVTADLLGHEQAQAVSGAVTVPPEPTASPTPSHTPTSSAGPTGSPGPTGTPGPTGSASDTPTEGPPSSTASPTPTGAPSPTPTADPTPSPSGGAQPTPPAEPTVAPTAPADPGLDPLATGAVVKVKVSQTSVRLAKGAKITIVAKGYTAAGKARKATFTSSKAKVAKVSASGVIQARRAGVATITVQAGGKTAKVKVTVVAKRSAAKVSKVTARGVPATMKVGQTAWASARHRPAKATGVKVTYKSSRPAIARVDKAGRLVALAPGSTTVTVKAGGKSAKVKVTVTQCGDRAGRRPE